MKRFLKIALIGVPVFIIILAVAAYFGLNSIVKTGVETIGPKITKTDVSMGSVSISPFSGRGEIGDFVMGNPEGFKSDSLLKAKDIVVSVDPKSLTSDPIVINEIVVDQPEVTYEASIVTGSNVSKVIDNINEFTSKIPGGGEGEKEPAPKEEGPQKKIIIKHFLVNEGKVRIVSKDLMGAGAVLTLPTIDKRDIGTKTGGVTMGEAAELTLGVILESAGSVGKDSANLVGGGGKAVEDAVGGAVKGVGDAIGGLIGKKKEEAPK